MTQRSHLILAGGTASAVALVIGPRGFLMLLEFLFVAFATRLRGQTAAGLEDAATQFGLALGALAAAIPLAALVTERFARRARYAPALAKSLLVGLLAFGAAWFYQREQFAALERLAVKMPGLFGDGGPPASWPGNPLTKVVWFSVACVLAFGPLDLWIARLQKRWRKPAAGVEARGEL